MSDELFTRVLVQLEPELAQEFVHAMLEDREKLKALEIIKKKIIPLTNFTMIIKPGEKNHYTIGNNWNNDLYLTQEEYNILKEILK